MAGITLAQAQTRLDAWLEADAAVARNQSYSINNRTLTRADAEQIRTNIDYWQSKVNELTASAGGGRRVRYGVAAD
jgi:hypothetical protein